MKIVRRGALPVGGDSGLAEIRERALAGFGDVGKRGEVRRGGRLGRLRRKGAVVRRSRRDPAASRRRRRRERDGRGDAPARARPAPAAGRRPMQLRARRDVPEPRAEPAAARESRVHRPEDPRGERGSRRRVRRRRRPLLLRRRDGRVRPRRLRHRAPCALDPREAAGLEGHLRRPCELGGAEDDLGRRRRAARQPRRPRVHQAPDAEGGRGLRRRGLGALLLPRLLERRLRRRPVPAHAGTALAHAKRRSPRRSRPIASTTSSRARSTRPSPTFPLKLQELKERYAGEGGRISHLDGLSVDFDDWHFNVRPSNTEPLLRLNLEALSPELMETKRDEVLALIRD